MGMFSIRANVTVDPGIKDRDTWAVDLVEGSNLSEDLKAGWFWATWPDRVELVFAVNAHPSSVQLFAKEIEALVTNAGGVVGKATVVVQEKGRNET
jgi:hypothetical protein